MQDKEVVGSTKHIIGSLGHWVIKSLWDRKGEGAKWKRGEGQFGILKIARLNCNPVGMTDIIAPGDRSVSDGESNPG